MMLIAMMGRRAAVSAPAGLHPERN